MRQDAELESKPCITWHFPLQMALQVLMLGGSIETLWTMDNHAYDCTVNSMRRETAYVWSPLEQNRRQSSQLLCGH